jgi:hypothetical protein
MVLMMPAHSTYRRAPRGRVTIGFQLEAPSEIEVNEGAILHCRELREDGRTVGELDVQVFSAALIIDRDGILAQKACEVLGQEASVRAAPTAVAVRLPGVSGFRADAVRASGLRYVHVFAVAPHDLGVDGGVLVTVRCAGPDWPAAEAMLRSLRIVTRYGTAPANDGDDPGPLLPVVVPTR